MIRKLALLALCWTALVVVFGAYVRLSDAGLGCPDWPGCYGSLTPHHAADAIGAAHAVEPLGPVSMPKAWKEMIHRYLASGLGVLIVAIAWLSLRRRRQRSDAPSPWLAVSLVGVVIFQGLLGKWTVTLLLKPAIVSLHLLGGLTVFGLLVWLCLREWRAARRAVGGPLLRLARIGFFLLLAQIALGGWVSTNYAALACMDMPTCQGSLLPQMDFDHGFHAFRELGETAEGNPLPLAALTAIHWTHRLGAVLLSVWMLLLMAALMRQPGLRRYALGLGLLLGVQICLGVANVVLGLPLWVAVGHNAGAMLLLGLLILINYRVHKKAAPFGRYAP